MRRFLVDLRKAFDSVRHCELLEATQKEGVSGKFAGTVKAMYSSLRSCEKTNTQSFFFFLNVLMVFDKDVYEVQHCFVCLSINWQNRFEVLASMVFRCYPDS